MCRSTSPIPWRCSPSRAVKASSDGADVSEVNKLGSVLVVTADDVLSRAVEKADVAYRVAIADEMSLCFTMLHERRHEVVVLDHDLPGAESGLEEAVALGHGAPFVVVADDHETGEKAVRRGLADDSLARKDASTAAMARAIRLAAYRHQAMRELAAASERSRRLGEVLDAADELVLLVDSAEEVFVMNPSARRFFGIDERTRPLPLKVSELFTDDVVDFWQDVLPEVMLAGSWQGEITLRGGGDSGCRFRLNVLHHDSPIPHVPSYFSLIAADLTPFEEAAKRAHAERLVKAKDRFIASVSHELRTPLTAVLGFSELLLASDLDDSVSLAEIAALIVEQARELSLIADDLAFGAGLEQTLSVESVEMDLGEQLLLAADPLRSSMEGRLHVSAEPLMVWGDPDRVRQVIRNLLTNTVRYGGDTVVALVRREGDTAVIEVRDNGLGVPDDRASLIFEPYETDGSHPAAMGLGLTIARSLASRMGGSLVYERTDGWTAFTLRLAVAA